MKTVDRINAAIRAKKYKKAFERYQKSILPGQADISLPPTSDCPWPMMSPLSPAASILCNKFKIPYPFAPGQVVLNCPSVIPVGLKIGPSEDLWMTVKIDMTQKLGPIQEDIKRLHDQFKIKMAEEEEAKAKSKRDRDTKVINIWEAYDRAQNMERDQVAQSYGMTNKPSCDKESDKIRQRVYEALDKANKRMAAYERGEL